MKKIAVLTTICILFFNTRIHAQSWILQTSNTTNALQKIFFYDSLHGWAVGANGTIVRTVDGGQNWLVSNSGTTQYLFGVYFISNSVGWVVGNNGILKTSNGGNSWSPQNSGTNNGLLNVFFMDSLHGWITDGYSDVLRTINGGTNWTLVSSGISCSGSGNVELAFTSITNGFVGCTCGHIGHTIDSGVTYSQISGLGPQPELICFARNHTDGYIANTSLAAPVSKTSNSGSTWIQISISSRPFTNVQDISCVSSDTVFICGGQAGGNGTVIYSFDGGNTWNNSFPFVTSNKTSISFVDSYNGWACSDDGNIWKWDLTSATLTNTYSYLCKGSNYSIPFTTAGTFMSGNTFQLLMSDANGVFSPGTVLSSVSSTVGGVFNTQIPVSTPNGTNYRLKITGSNPIYESKMDTSAITIETPTGNFSATAQLLTYPAVTAQLTNASVDPNLTYSWNFGDGTAPIQNNNTSVFHTYTHNGLYDVSLVITNAGGCTDTVPKLGYIDVVGIPSSGILEIANQSIFSVYPNPTNSELTIEAADNKVEQIKVFNISGQKAAEFSNPANNKITVSELTNGIYFIEATVKGSVLRAKFVKE